MAPGKLNNFNDREGFVTDADVAYMRARAEGVVGGMCFMQGVYMDEARKGKGCVGQAARRDIGLDEYRKAPPCRPTAGESPFCYEEKTMKANKVDHICIAVKDLDAARKVWEPILGKSEPDDPYVDEPERIRVARYWIGEVGFELMESTTPDGPVAKWIEKNGEGVMVVSLNVENTREAIKELESKNYPFIPAPNGEKARPFRDCEFAFIHPKKVNSVLLELIDCKWDELKKK